MKALRIDHVGIVVKNIQEATATYARHFGLQVDPTRGGKLPALGIENAFMPIGDSALEFIQPLTDQGPVAQFARERGEGQYLLSIEVDDLVAAVEHLRSLGYRVSDPTNGVAFVSPKSSHGVNLQLIQRSGG
ncbi:VOC family protein [Tepidiforma sp.]|uniref:VOC family protein n=1 Tax=Tepidiforma sp. TaxID=2682230 RepID=UPI002ADD8A4C|nr:VOC family protein [Tepidiforma sp.]